MPWKPLPGYAFSIDLGFRTSSPPSIPETGAKTINPKVVPSGGTDPIMVCPHAGGAKNCILSSDNPDTNLNVPLVESCTTSIPAPPGKRPFLSSGVNSTIRPRPDSDGKYGRFQAINLMTREAWSGPSASVRHKPPAHSPPPAASSSTARLIASSALMTTNGKCYGKCLNDVPSSCPITYTVNGKQQIAAVVGNGGAHAGQLGRALVPQIQNPPDHGAALWVFELPRQPTHALAC